MKKLSDYRLIVFDCDGVIMNSNAVKTCAFGNSVKFLGQEAVNSFKNYHIQNGGISRYEKFKYFVDNIVPDLGITQNIDCEYLLKAYSREVSLNLLSCEIDESIFNLRAANTSSWAVASGSDQQELREIFFKRDLTKLFELGVWGSPSSKQEIFNSQFSQFSPSDILFLGDSFYDYQVSIEFNIDFAFISHWSEFKEILELSNQNQIPIFTSLAELLASQSD